MNVHEVPSERAPRGLMGSRTKSKYYSFSLWLSQHIVLASLIIFLCSLGPRLAMTVIAEPLHLAAPESDSPTYLVPALNLHKSGAFLNKDGEPEVSRTPGYPMFLAALVSMVGKDVHALAIAQSIVLSFSVLMLYWLARTILPPVMAFTGCLLACFSPWSIVRSGLILTEGLYLFLLVLAFALIRSLEVAEKRTLATLWAVLAGIVVGAIVLVRPVWFVVPIMGTITFLRLGLKRKGVFLLVAVMLVSSIMPLHVWTLRNIEQGQFNGLSDVPGKAAWFYLASRVRAQADNMDRWQVMRSAVSEDGGVGLPLEKADRNRWNKAAQVFIDHPFLTVSSFLSSAAEHFIHPSPDVLTPARLNFRGDFWLLALLWIGFLGLAYVGWRCSPDPGWDDGDTDRGWLFALLATCITLTIITGFSFGGGSRMRAPLELIVPLLAGMGLVRMIRSFGTIPVKLPDEQSLGSEANAKPILAVLIPVFNEVHSIKRLMKRVLSSATDLDLRVFVVDDCSSDGSAIVLDQLASEDSRITVLHHTANQGKGAAIRTAIETAWGDFAIIQDADFEYDPNDYSRISAPLVRGSADAVFGSRYMNRNERQVQRYWHSLGNSMLTTCFNIFHDAHLTDMETCYKAMPLRLLKSLRLTTDRFGIEPEIAARLVAVRARIMEVPISYHPRSYCDGKKIGWKDGLEAIYLILKFKFVDTIPCHDAAMLRHLAMAEAPRYQQAVARQIEPFLGTRVLEAGAGIGNLAKHISLDKELILAEPTTEFRLQLAGAIAYRDNVTVCEHDLFTAHGAAWARSVKADTVISINQLELMDDDKLALDSLASSVPPGGRVILLLSAQQNLYGSLDLALNRRRRYSTESVTALLRAVGLKMVEQRGTGKLLVLGWFLESKVCRRQFFASKSVAWVDILSPCMNQLDRWLPWNGLSLLVVARKAAP